MTSILNLQHTHTSSFALKTSGLNLDLRSGRGFTLIELLVVIAIVSFLFSIVAASLNTAREKARDGRRLSDMRQIETALQLYFDDNNEFPCENASNCSNQSSGANGKIGEGAGLDTLLAPYLPTVSADPLGPGNSTFFYYYDGRHCNSEGSGSVAVISFNKAESDSDIRRDTTCGGEGNQDDADYNVIVGPSSG